jgi:hypothetical protein
LLPSEPHLSLSQGSEGSFVVNCLNHAFHSALGLSMSLRRKVQVKAWGSTFVKLKKLTSSVPKQRQAPVHITPSNDFTL